MESEAYEPQIYQNNIPMQIQNESYELQTNVNDVSLIQQNSSSNNEIVNVHNNTHATQNMSTPQRINNLIYEKIQQEWDYEHPFESCGYITLKSTNKRER